MPICPGGPCVTLAVLRGRGPGHRPLGSPVGLGRGRLMWNPLRSTGTLRVCSGAMSVAQKRTVGGDFSIFNAIRQEQAPDPSSCCQNPGHRCCVTDNTWEGQVARQVAGRSLPGRNTAQSPGRPRPVLRSGLGALAEVGQRPACWRLPWASGPHRLTQVFFKEENGSTSTERSGQKVQGTGSVCQGPPAATGSSMLARSQCAADRAAGA